MRENCVSWDVISGNVDEAEAIFRMNHNKTHIDDVWSVSLSGKAEEKPEVISAQPMDLTSKLAPRLPEKAEYLADVMLLAAASRLSGKLT